MAELGDGELSHEQSEDGREHGAHDGVSGRFLDELNLPVTDVRFGWHRFLLEQGDEKGTLGSQPSDESNSV